jgi:hypothetical protein
MGRLWTRSRGAGVRRGAAVAVVGVATVAGAAAVAAPALATARFKVLGGDVYQETSWTSHSASDNGCYAGTFADSGSTKVFMTARRGAVVRATRSDDPTFGMVLTGLKFRGVMHQDGDFKDDWTPDQSPPPSWCGPATGALYAPPSTADCGPRDIGAAESDLQVTVPLGRSPRLPPALVGTFYGKGPYDACPSDDPVYATQPIFVRAGESVAAFSRRTITLTANKSIRGSGLLYYRGLNARDGDRTATIHWELKLKRLG